jgi:four helix bundle protein
MAPDELRARTQRFATDIVRFCRALPNTEEGHVFSRQLLRAGTSVGANYRAVCRPRSNADFIAKLGTVIEDVTRRPSGLSWRSSWSWRPL